MTATLDTFSEEDVQEASDAIVVATCIGCGATHPIGDRETSDNTTASTICPSCGSPSYATDVEVQEEVER